MVKKKISITIDESVNERLNVFANKNQKVKSQIIEVAISEYLEKEQKKMDEVEEYLAKFVSDMGK